MSGELPVAAEDSAQIYDPSNAVRIPPVALAYAEAVRSQNLDRIAACFSENAYFSGALVAKPLIGRDAIKQYYEKHFLDYVGVDMVFDFHDKAQTDSPDNVHTGVVDSQRFKLFYRGPESIQLAYALSLKASFMLITNPPGTEIVHYGAAQKEEKRATDIGEVKNLYAAYLSRNAHSPSQ